ncbi:hypothetical protein D6821_00985, partial [Candidatus Parcubacteria bacterium]
MDLPLAIKEVIAFFDLFSFPLTSREIWQFLRQPVGWQTIIKILNHSRGDWEEWQGFYFLPGRRHLVTERERRYNFSCWKFRRAIFLSRLFAALPTVKAVAMANLVGQHNLRASSDIDLFIIAKQDRLWTTRLYCVLMTELLGWRPKPNNKKDKICLSFFIDESALNLEPLSLDKDDWYFQYWLANLYFVYGQGDTIKRFYQANQWIKKHLPNWHEPVFSQRRFKQAPVKKFFNGSHKLEQRLFSWQSSKLKSLYPSFGEGVVISANIAKLHFKDRRQYFINWVRRF